MNALKTIRDDVRNVAIIAHVDHGKTTLVDAMLKQSHIFRENQTVGDLILDSNVLERERGITILSKNTAINYQNVKINIIDTPGHADFSGEVERVLNMADGALLLVDALDGPMPGTRFVLKKALELGLKPLVVINKIDRPNARINAVHDAVQDLFLELATDVDQLDFSVVYTNARAGLATLDPSQPGQNISPLFDAILREIPAPVVDLDDGFQLLVANISYDDYVGRAAIGRVRRGRLHVADQLVCIGADGLPVRQKAVQIFAFDGLRRVTVEEARAGDVIGIVGLQDVQIGDTIATVEAPEALPRLEVEAPTVQMTIGVNSSPLGGQDGKYCTSRQLRARLFRELETNVALRVEQTGSADEFLVSGRGELHLSILLETMRREGYELQVSQPSVITRLVDGRVQEPFEHVVVDTLDAYVGPMTEQMAKRLGQMVNLHQNGDGHVRLEYIVPTRGLIGLRGVFLTLTRGDGTMSSQFVGYQPWAGPITIPRNSAVVNTGAGVATTYALGNIQERSSTFIEPGTRVYEGMIIGMTQHPHEIIANITKEKKMTNVRSSTSDIAVRLTPSIIFTLEEALAFIGPDELVELTPRSIRLRKKLRTSEERAKARRVPVGVTSDEGRGNGRRDEGMDGVTGDEG
ncbi:MAG TPA: translational GTPase TypA [Chloroflexota bacterium]|nr:translational GTPase TypA [Chloroflexota bacterium]